MEEGNLSLQAVSMLKQTTESQEKRRAHQLPGSIPGGQTQCERQRRAGGFRLNLLAGVAGTCGGRVDDAWRPDSPGAESLGHDLAEELHCSENLRMAVLLCGGSCR